VFHQQDDISLWPQLAKFATNNHQSETTGVTPFCTNNGGHSCLNFNIIEQQDLLENYDAQEHITKLQANYLVIFVQMRLAQAKKYDNAEQHHNSAPSYQVGDLFSHNARNIIRQHPSVNLNCK
jgi:hypothetical protein